MNADVFADESKTEKSMPEEKPSEPKTMADVPDMSDYLDDYETPKRGDICSGAVIGRDEQGLIVDVGLKREGLVPADDLARLDDETRDGIEVGSDVQVFVLRPEGRDGHPILSVYQAYMYQDWLDAEEMLESGELYEGEVSGYNRGGLIVKFGKIRGFVPASQVVGLPRNLSQSDRRQRLASKVGEKVGLKIIEVNRRRRRLIFSQRRALRAWQEAQRERLINELKEGETRHGTVSDITDFGVFVDLGGADGLIHVSELSWGRVENPRDMLKPGDELDVYILGVDRERKRIALSLKKLQPDPWLLVDEHYTVGQLVEGRVTRVLDFGAFIELEVGVEGLLHVSEMIGTPELKPTDIVQSGDKILVKVIRINSRRRRIALSAKQVRRNEWERWVVKQQEAEEAAAEETEGEVPEAQEPVAEAAEATVQPEAEEQPKAGEETAEEPIAETAEVTAQAEAEEQPKAGEETAEEPIAETAEVTAQAEAEEPEAEEGTGEEPIAETVEVTAQAEAEEPEAEEGTGEDPEAEEPVEEEAVASAVS